MSDFERWWQGDCTPYVKSGLADKEVARAIWDAACESCADAVLHAPESCETPTGDKAISAEAAYDVCIRVKA